MVYPVVVVVHVEAATAEQVKETVLQQNVVFFTDHRNICLISGYICDE